MSIKKGFHELYDLSKLDPETLATLCKRNTFSLLVAQAESATFQATNGAKTTDEINQRQAFEEELHKRNSKYAQLLEVVATEFIAQTTANEPLCPHQGTRFAAAIIDGPGSDDTQITIEASGAPFHKRPFQYSMHTGKEYDLSKHINQLAQEIYDYATKSTGVTFDHTFTFVKGHSSVLKEEPTAFNPNSLSSTANKTVVSMGLFDQYGDHGEQLPVAFFAPIEMRTPPNSSYYNQGSANDFNQGSANDFNQGSANDFNQGKDAIYRVRASLQQSLAKRTARTSDTPLLGHMLYRQSKQQGGEDQLNATNSLRFPQYGHRPSLMVYDTCVALPSDVKYNYQDEPMALDLIEASKRQTPQIQQISLFYPGPVYRETFSYGELNSVQLAALAHSLWENRPQSFQEIAQVLEEEARPLPEEIPQKGLLQLQQLGKRALPELLRKANPNNFHQDTERMYVRFTSCSEFPSEQNPSDQDIKSELLCASSIDAIRRDHIISQIAPLREELAKLLFLLNQTTAKTSARELYREILITLKKIEQKRIPDQLDIHFNGNLAQNLAWLYELEPDGIVNQPMIDNAQKIFRAYILKYVDAVVTNQDPNHVQSAIKLVEVIAKPRFANSPHYLFLTAARIVGILPAEEMRYGSDLSTGPAAALAHRRPPFEDMIELSYRIPHLYSDSLTLVQTYLQEQISAYLIPEHNASSPPMSTFEFQRRLLELRDRAHKEILGRL